MILQQLYHDASTILGELLPPPMYDVKPVRWVIELTTDGQFVNFLPLGGMKENRRGLPRLVPYLGRTYGVRAILLADSPAYVLGVAPEDKRAEEKHTAFKALIHQCAEETGEPSVKAVKTFLASWDPETATTPAEMTPADLLTFQVGGGWPTEAESVQAFWARTARPAGDAEAKTQCLVTGLIGPTEKSLPGVIKGVPGGQMGGIALVSANAAAFESYGLERAQTSPISAEAAERFTKALNKLIAGERTHITLGGLVYVFWTSEPGDDFYDLIDQADPAQVRDLLRSFREGKRYTAIDQAKFHAFSLSASGARAVIRDQLNTTVGHAHERLARWFADHEIVDAYGEGTQFFSPFRLTGSLFRDPRKDATPQTPQALLRSALHGEPIPRSLLDRAVLRCRAEQRVTPARAALMKAALIRLNRPDTPEDPSSMTELNAQRTDPPYLCGRLLAELEVIQRAALGKTNTTLIDRYFGAASTTPATVFGILLTNANKAHLPKLRKQNEGAYNALQDRIAEIVAPLQGFPKTLTLQEQALFSLGFYHQRAADRQAARLAKERKLRGEATAADETLIDATDANDLSTQEDK